MQISGIQILRGVAAVLIVIYHATAHPLLSSIGQIGILQAGVDLFFVISGFVMWITTESRNYQSPWQFWRLRITRVVPLYWAATLAYIVVTILLPSQLFSATSSSWAIISSFLFIPAWHSNGEIVPIYSLGWTLNYEMFFYFIFGLCLLFRTRAARLIAFSLIIAVLIAGGIAIIPTSAIGKLYTNPIVTEFLAGVLIGAIFNRLQRPFHSRAAGIALSVLAVAILAMAHVTSLPRLVGFGLPAVLSVVAALFLDQPRQRRDVKIGALLGDGSYSIYLAHPFVLRPFFLAATIFIPTPTAGVQLALVVGATIAGVIGGMGCYKLIETPLTSLARRLLSPADVRASATNDQIIRRK